MNGYLLPLVCLCGSPLDHVAGSTAAGTETNAVCKCSRCSREWLLSVVLRPAPVPESIRRRDRRKVAA